MKLSLAPLEGVRLIFHGWRTMGLSQEKMVRKSVQLTLIQALMITRRKGVLLKDFRML